MYPIGIDSIPDRMTCCAILMCGVMSISAVCALSKDRKSKASALGENCAMFPGNRISGDWVCWRREAIQGSMDRPVLPPTKIRSTPSRYGKREVYAFCLLGSMRTANKGECCFLCVVMMSKIFMLLPCHRLHDYAYIFAEIIKDRS